MLVDLYDQRGLRLFRERPDRAHPRAVATKGSCASMLSAAEQLADALEAVARGDRCAFEYVYAATSAKLYGIILRILGRREIAEDVLQEVYLLVWQRAAAFDRTQASGVTWLAAIARNRALDEKKRKGLVATNELDEALNLAADEDPLADCARNDELRRVLSCLDRLDPEHRRTILLAFDKGLTREEIAVHTGRPSGTIKTWVRRGLAQLKECLSR